MSKSKKAQRGASEVETLGEGRWYYRCMTQGKPWEVWAFVSLESMEIGLSEEPLDPIAKPHEGGGSVYTVLEFRRGMAAGWNKRHPALYAVISAYVDRHLPKTPPLKHKSTDR